MTTLLSLLILHFSTLLLAKSNSSDFYTNTDLRQIEKDEYEVNLSVNNTRNFYLILTRTRKLPKELLSKDFSLLIIGNESISRSYTFNFLNGFSPNNSVNVAAGYMKNNRFYGKFEINCYIYRIGETVNKKYNAVVRLEETRCLPKEPLLFKKVNKRQALYYRQEKYFYYRFIGPG